MKVMTSLAEKIKLVLCCDTVGRFTETGCLVRKVLVSCLNLPDHHTDTLEFSAEIRTDSQAPCARGSLGSTPAKDLAHAGWRLWGLQLGWSFLAAARLSTAADTGLRAPGLSRTSPAAHAQVAQRRRADQPSLNADRRGKREDEGRGGLGKHTTWQLTRV